MKSRNSGKEAVYVARESERRRPVKLLASAEATPVSLYLATDGNEAGEFRRTSSRLIEMSSESYLALPHGRKDSAASGSTTGLVET